MFSQFLVSVLDWFLCCFRPFSVEASSSQITPPSPPPPSDRDWKYDVFLSFRGTDTRKGITSDLHGRLQSSGVRTFMDDPDLQVGDAISHTLIEAIEGSRFAIVVLSRDYASSTWCLEELTKICECMEDQNRILPLFYHVEPTDVRYQKRSFEQAFSKHVKDGRHNPKKVKQWRDALYKVATFSGWNTNDHKTERGLVEAIVDFVSSKVVPDAIESTGDFQAFKATKQAMDEVMQALKDDEVTAIGVYGMGGVGKTTMVEHVGVNARRSGLFDYVTTVVVSQNPDFEKLQHTLAGFLGFKLPDGADFTLRAATLHKKIMTRTKVLIILDDIWERRDLSSIGIPSHKELQKCQSKVLLTTRIKNVCHVMECQREITLNILSEQDSWALFVRKARRTFESPTFEGVAKKVAGECKGLPIALVTVARALGDKELVEWRIAARALQNSKPANPDDNRDAFKCIKFSYNYLKDEEYKSYFLLCCLFPEDSNIPVEILFRYAMGMGLFQDAETLGEARETADSVARHLKYSSLLLEGNNNEYVRMHDVVRDAAIQIAQHENGFLVKPGCCLQDWPRKLHENCSAISLTRNYIRRLPEKLVCPKLQILLLNHNYFLKETPPDNFFQSPNELRVLDISNTPWPSLPQSLSLLTNLRVLFLNRCPFPRIETSILGKLKNLEILSMRTSKLKQLPIDIGGLTNLRLLDITSSATIVRIPAKVISKLHNLEELNMHGFREWGSRVEGEGEEINVGFDEVTSLSKVRVLRVSISDVECLPKFVEFNPKWVEFDICIGREDHRYLAPENSDRFNSIRLELDVISRLPEWFRNEIMNLAERIRWEECHQSLNDIFVESENGRFQRLKQLDILGPKDVMVQRRRVETFRVGLRMNRLNTVTWVSKNPVFENLEELRLFKLDCAGLCAAELAPGSLLNLKSLVVNDCYNWGSILLPSTLLRSLLNLEELQCRITEEIIYVFGYEALLVSKQIKLRKIVLDSLPGVVSLWDGPALPATIQNLQTLSIRSCKQLHGSLFSLDVAQSLSQLNRLDLHDCALLGRIVEEGNKKIILPKLKQLTLKDLPMVYYESASFFDIECPSLEELDITGCKQLQRSLFSLDVAQSLSQLNCLHLHDCALLERIVEEGNKKIILPKLKRLSLNALPMVCYESASFFDIECPSLEELDITECKQLQGSLFSHDVAQCLSQLYCLHLHDCALLERIVEEGNKKIILPKLKRLSLNALPMVCYESASFFYIECPSLEELDITECKQLQGSLFSHDVAQCLSQLNYLHLHDCASLERIVKEGNKKIILPKLKRLSLKDLPMVCSESASFFDIECPLKEVDISGCKKLKGSLFSLDVAQSLSQLNCLHLHHCALLERIVEEGNKIILPKLKQLSLKDLPMVCSESASFFDIKCPSLEELDITGCKQLQGSLFSLDVAQSLSQLNCLDLQDCALLERIVEEGNKKIIFPKLKQLRLKDLPMVCSESASFFDIECPSLKKLDITRCKQLQGSLFYHDVAQSLSQLNFLHLHDCALLERIVEEGNKKIILPKLNRLSLKDLPMVCSESASFFYIECPSLKGLEITGCKQLQGSLFSFDVAQSLSQLNCLQLHDCALLEMIVKEGNKKIILPKLKRLSLKHLPMVCPESASFFYIECPSLKGLEITGCKQLQGSLFSFDVAQSLSQLNWFHLQDCALLERIVEEGNKKIILPKLKRLSLKDLPMVYYESASFFDIECPSLKDVDISGCKQL